MFRQIPHAMWIELGKRFISMAENVPDIIFRHERIPLCYRYCSERSVTTNTKLMMFTERPIWHLGGSKGEVQKCLEI